MNDNENETVVKETVVENNTSERNSQVNPGTEQNRNSTVVEKTVVGEMGQGNLRARKIIYYLLGIVEILLAFRFILRLLGANPGNAFVNILYSVTTFLLWPFSGIFSTAVTTGLETKSYFEPATIIAMIVYGIVAWGIVKLIRIMKKSNMPKQ